MQKNSVKNNICSLSIKILLSTNTHIFVHRNYKCPNNKAKAKNLKLKIIIAEFKILVCPKSRASSFRFKYDYKQTGRYTIIFDDNTDDLVINHKYIDICLNVHVRFVLRARALLFPFESLRR